MFLNIVITCLVDTLLLLSADLQFLLFYATRGVLYFPHSY